jgi:2-hydroxycyclohexanecarboxyl-CoA dehydrogenase
MASNFRAQTALVTGAGQGLGQAIVRRLHADGLRVAAHDIAETYGLRNLRDELRAAIVTGDFADPAAAPRVAAEAERALGSVDVLVVNHATMAMAPFADQDPRLWWRHIQVNLTASFQLAQAVVPGMRRRGGGRIVFISSEAGVVGMRNATAYSASKGGIIALTKSLGRELAAEDIIANAIAPSYMNTPQLEVDAADAGVSRAEIRRRYAAVIPVGRVAEPAEIAAVVSYLAGPYAGAVVGQVLQPNGGTTRARA